MGPARPCSTDCSHAGFTVLRSVLAPGLARQVSQVLGGGALVLAGPAPIWRDVPGPESLMERKRIQ